MVGIRSGSKAKAVSSGSLLKKARRHNHISLEEVSRLLRIPITQLAALEEGDLSVFAAEMYARGAFLKYARWLGVGSVEVEKSFLKELSGVREVVPLKMLTPSSLFSRLLHPRMLIAGAGGLVVLVVGSYFLWQVQSFLRLPAVTITQPALAQVDTPDVVVKGHSAYQNAIAVNGEPVLLASDGTFSVPLTLHPGVNIVRVEAHNAAGRVKVVEKDLLLSRAGR